MTTKHTPEPWSIMRDPEDGVWITTEHHGDICYMNEYMDKGRPEEGKANVEFIVQACNSHDELLEACKLAQKYVAKMVADDIQTAMPPQIALDRIEQAIVKAEGIEV